MIFRTPKLKPGLYSGIVTARSSEVPGRDITYTVAVQNDDGEVKFTGVSPQSRLRWSAFDDTLNLVPFTLGTRVVVHVVPDATGLRAIIGDSELPEHGACS